MSSKTNPLTRGKKQKALALLQRNLPAEAVPLLEQACRADRRDAEIWYLLGAANHRLGKLSAAAEHYRRAIEIEPQHSDAYYHLGNIHLALGQPNDATENFRHAVRINPIFIEAHCNLGKAYELQDMLTEAVEHYRLALRLDPTRPELHYNLGNILQRLGQWDAAATSYRQAISLKPDFAEAHNNLGNVLRAKSDWNEATACYRRAVALKPNYIEAHYNLGVALRMAGHLDEAINSYGQVLVRDPNHVDTHFNLAFAQLLMGRFKEGWKEYAWRWMRENSGRRPFAASAWDGSDLGGQAIFLHAEQGLGDELFFLRFVTELRRRGAGSITYLPNPKLASLLARVTLIDRLATTGDTPASGERVFSVGDLPLLLGMERIDRIPSPLTLVPLPEQVETVRARLAKLGPPPYLGVTWRAGEKDKHLALSKACPFDRLARTFAQYPATVLILQRRPQPGEIEAFTQALGRTAHDLSALNEDLESMLALLALIDDYVGVSNTNMHLRAGVGKTARVLVPAPPEWRWMAEGKESPWFPGFTVYRQGYDGSWEGAFAELSQSLRNPG